MEAASLLLNLSIAIISAYMLYNIIENLRGFRRLPRPDETSYCSKISVIIPVRNEEGRIGKALTSILDKLGPDDEVLVVDDASSDNTFSEAVDHCDERCVLIKVLEKPDGWNGKPWACYQGYLHSRGDILLFMDADVIVKERLKGICSLLNEYDALSQVPKIKCDSLACGSIEMAFTSLLRLTYPYWNMTYGKGWLAGAFMWWKRQSYEIVGTHESVKDSPVEDAELGREAVEKGMRIAFFTGEIAESSWISSWHEGLLTLTRILTARAPRPLSALLVASILIYVSLASYLVPITAILGYTNPIISIIYLGSIFGYASISLKEVDTSPLSLTLAPVGLILLSAAMVRASLGAEIEWKGRLLN